jgi:hypothetical protein
MEKELNPFLERAKSQQYTISMDKSLAELFLTAVFLEKNKDVKSLKKDLDTSELGSNFLLQILKKRIVALDLPIEFTLPAAIAAISLASNPGKIVTLLIDCLTAYEGETITINKLTEMYPFGFYNEETFIDYIDNYLKPRKVAWSEVY